MLKKEARKIFKAKRQAITTVEKQKWDDLILIQFQTLKLPFIENVFSYVALEAQKEVDTTNIIRYLNFINPALRVAYPVCNFGDCTIKAMITNDKTAFALNSYQIPEPESIVEMEPAEIDAVLVPLLCFDKRGYRVGYGKGFYDRFFTKTKSEIVKIGLSYFEPIESVSDRDDFDVPLDYCVTPGGIYEFGSR